MLIHLDFKGAPPKFEFLMDLITFIAKDHCNSSKVVTGFLLEFEDMLPFSGTLECIRKDKYPTYTRDQIK